MEQNYPSDHTRLYIFILGKDALIPTEISDHYPIEIMFKAKMHPLIQSFIKVNQQVELEDVRVFVNRKSFHKMNQELLSPFLLVGDGRNGCDEICAEFNSMEAVIEAFNELRSNVPKVISYSLMASIRHQLNCMQYNKEKYQGTI